jgi:signal transduction histidine kinase
VHELKAPLVAVEGYLRLLQEGAATDPETAKRAVDRSLVRLDGMRKLIVDLLDLTRIESGQKAREFTPVDLVEVARAAIETALPAAQERSISLELHAPGPVALQADRGEIEIMLNNLVSNAVKYNRDSGRVDVTVSDGPAGVTMVVKDTGIGMTKEERQDPQHPGQRVGAVDFAQAGHPVWGRRDGGEPARCGHDLHRASAGGCARE